LGAEARTNACREVENDRRRLPQAVATPPGTIPGGSQSLARPRPRRRHPPDRTHRLAAARRRRGLRRAV